MCGEHVERDIRPGRRKWHVECGISWVANYNRGLIDGTNPDLAKHRARGAAQRKSIEERKGEYWTRWAGGMARYLGLPNNTEDS